MHTNGKRMMRVQRKHTLSDGNILIEKGKVWYKNGQRTTENASQGRSD